MTDWQYSETSVPSPSKKIKEKKYQANISTFTS